MATTSTTKPRRRKPTRPGSPGPPPPRPPATVGDLLKQLGNVPAWRVRLNPAPGTATVEDVIRTDAHEDRPCELVEGTLVEKAVGYEESDIAGVIITALNIFIRPRKLGIVTGEAGPFELLGGLVRYPDVAFTSWDRLPGRKRPKAPVPRLAPDLAVEVLSKSNTPAEIKRKLGEYFGAGVRLVWVVDPKKRTVRVHTSAARSVLLKEGQSLDGGDVLPGFRLSLREIFAEPEL
jgi:Uma2 family endonuclease